MPDGVTITVKCRKVNVSGPRGKLSLDLSHLPIDLKVSEDGKKVIVERWFTSGKQAASIHTAISHVSNCFIGVTRVRPAPPAAATTRLHQLSSQRFNKCSLPTDRRVSCAVTRDE